MNTAAPFQGTKPYQRTRRPLAVRIKLWLRATTVVALILTWSVATFTGAILWPELGITPPGPGKGEKEMLWTLTTETWALIHTYSSFAAVAVTGLHLWIDWKATKGAFKYLVHAKGIPA